MRGQICCCQGTALLSRPSALFRPLPPPLPPSRPDPHSQPRSRDGEKKRPGLASCTERQRRLLCAPEGRARRRGLLTSAHELNLGSEAGLWMPAGQRLGASWMLVAAAVAVDATLHVEWNEAKSLPALSALGHPRTSLVRRLVGQSSVDSQDSLEVNVEDTIEMLPKSRRALTIQEITALARSSLHGISQVVKDHVTKPTAMAQGRVAHLIEWKGWCKPMDSPVALESTFNSYSDLSEGEQEARFAAGVAEQFAIAEAKLRAWSSVDGEESNDESYDEDFSTPTDSTQPADAVDPLPASALLKGLLRGRLGQLNGRQGSCDPESDSSQTTVSPETLCSSLCSLEDSLLLKELGSPSELAAQLLGSVSGGEEAPPPKGPTQTAGECAFRSLAQLQCQDSLYSMSFTESCLSPTEDEAIPCKDCQVHGDSCQVRRKVSDVASSGVVSLDDNEEEEEEEEEEEAGGQQEEDSGGP